MSRVDDDRDAARVAARLAEAKRAEESKKTDKAAADSVFSKLVGKQKEQAQTQAGQTSARDAIAHLLEQTEAAATDHTQSQERVGKQAQGENAFKSKLGSKQLQEKVSQNSRSEGEHTQTSRAADDQGAQATQSGRAADTGAQAGRAEGRKADAKVTSERLEERKESSEASGAGKGGVGGARGEKGDIKTDSDKGGQGQGGGKDQKDGAGAMGAGFRFNPALMAPVPVAKQKDVGGSERLRKVANEIAQKIVERVRVGTNAAGKVEMQIDLRSDVLSGLSVKVSSHQGKIKAVFSGSDKDVLKAIEEQGEALKEALAKRGLTLEDFKVEART